MQASWKGRLFKLCKTAVDSYFIRYYAYDGVSMDYKGEILVSDIKSIDLGYNAMDKNMTTITNLFNNSPQNVLCIKTNKRVYYLLDENKENIKNWQKCITDVWVKINQTENVDGPQIKHTVLVAPPPVPPQGEATRPKSYPEDHPRSRSPLLDTQDRQRCHTDPTSRTEIPDCKPLNLLMTEPNLPQERKRSKTCSDAIPARNSLKKDFRRLSLSDKQETTSVDTAYYSDTEIYDVPRPGLNHLSVDYTEEEEDFDFPDENVYMCMEQISEEQNNHCPAKPPRNYRIIKSSRSPILQRSQLKRAYILKMMYEQDSSDYVKMHLTIPTTHLRNYFNIQEVGDRLCVSKWKGPVEIGCVFYHGDHINEINGFRPESRDFFFQMLNLFTRDKVITL
ncbi:hypothetical protein AB205_0015200 [Aquarana catesbeiana]|uniref:PH domain-containing protein n=1 Tax=Aquarana catesbeiana TaxID=8400 RepID=A0A2G9REZ6_AQUCT|nr:hypothetical protein AB205_0015200 [Aquarana catesbeiana]